MGGNTGQLQVTNNLASLVPSYAGQSNSSSVSSTSTRVLTLGSTGSDVKALQVFLNIHGFTVAVKGAGSLGNESTYYGPATVSALARFQAANGITPVLGNFGPITMGKVNQILTK